MLSPVKEKLPIAVVGLGGTISMTRDGRRGLVPTRGVGDLLRDYPELTDLADLDSHDLDLLDSCDLRPSHWTRLAEWIDARAGSHAGIVVTHGTDTMAHTAAALALAFGHRLTRPVVLTGAQKPPGDPGSDARDNLVGAVRAAVAAAEQGVAEVMIAFHRRALRGIRARKRSAVRAGAFVTLGLDPLATWDAHAEPVRFRPHARQCSDARPEPLRARFVEGVAHLCLTPGFPPDSLRAWLASGQIRALVLQPFGPGNIPNSGAYALAPVVREAVHELGIPVALASPFDGEPTGTAYANGLAAAEAGALPGGRRTPEAIAVKLAWLLGQGLGEPEIRQLWGQDVAGEGPA